MKRTFIFSLSVFILAHVTSLIRTDNDRTVPPERGNITGVVLDSSTGEPIVGAYVGVGDFGDSSGTNYTGHRKKGFFAKAETDRHGRFVLDGLAYREHPLVATHPEFVRHDRIVTFEKDKPEPDIKVNLRPAAKINVTVVDSAGKPLDDFWIIILEALDGRVFIPPGRDPHLSSFASSIWIERIMKLEPAKRSVSGGTGFSFNALDSGKYSIDVFKLSRIQNPVSPPEPMQRLPVNNSRITYHGGVESLAVEAGQTREAQIKPADYQTQVRIKMPEDPIKRSDIPPFISISRDIGLLLWYDGKVHGPEDHRNGRLMKKSFYNGVVTDGDVFEIINLPPGGYSVYAGPVYFMTAVELRVSKQREIVIDVPPTEPKETSIVGLVHFNKKVRLEDRYYSLSELCRIITETTGSRPRLVADAKIENEKLKPGDREMMLWDLMEKIYLAGRWKLSERDDKTLLLSPGK
jgi:hypothetical protein